jgi:FSR family fosmidomycin resistance protein-like MFS transporter
MLFASLASSVVQPAVGYLSDRRSMPWLIAGGVFLAGAGFALCGAMPSYWLIVLCVALSGLGIAAFHPEAARFANYVAGAKKATGMRWFAVGGNVGFALGPLLLTPLLVAFGPRGTLFMLIPATLAAALVLWEIPRLRGFVPQRPRVANAGGADRWGPFGVLTAYVVLRSMAYIGLVAFVPLYFIAELHVSKPLANIALTIFLSAGAAGTIVGGRLADKLGRRTMLLASMLATAPLLIASGVTLGLAISLGGAGTPVLGLIADHLGLPAVFEALIALLVLASLTALFLPRGERAAARAKATLSPA